jgi:LysM repeat protein
VTISDATAGTTIYYTTNGTAPTTSSAVYSSAITVSANETLEAIAVELGYTNSAVASAAYTIAPVLPTPTFSPDTGIFTTSQTVTISNATAGTTIHYTMDGTTPTSSSTVYTGPITVTATTTLQAIAAKTGFTNSPVATSICTINPLLPSPTFSAAAGTYTTSQTVSISEATAGTTIYYTTNGTAPTTSSAVYTGPITVSATETIEAMAVEMCYTNSPVAMAAYTINPVLPAPAFSIAAGTYTTFQTVTVSDATAGTTIYFTTNGVAPTTASTKYSGAVTVSTTETMEAIAVETGYTNSSVASAAYTINAGLPVPSFSVAAGTYTTSQTVSISDATAGTTIYYTTNGTAPTASSSVYSGPITVNATETLEAIAVETGYWTSSVAKAAYTIDQVLPAPAFSVAAGTYTTSQTVTISDATVGATIYYTTNGTAPTTSSSVYNGPITVSATETIEAIAVETGYTTSPVSTGAYTITGSTTTNVAEDFTITPSGTSATVAPGGSVTYALTVTPLSPATTFPAEISLSANGLPSGATYSFSPAAVAEGAGATAVTLTVQLPQNASAKQPAGGIRSLFVPRMAPLALGLLLLPFSGRLRRAGKKMERAMPAMLLVASATLAVIGLGGCGSTNAMIAPTQQSYTVAVIGTAGSVSKTTTVTLIVMQ